MIIDGYIDPKTLETVVGNKLRSLGITEYPFNPYGIVHMEGIILQEIPLEDEKIKGMLVRGNNATGILINSNRCSASRRFIAMHELIHYWFHPKNTETVCFDEYREDMSSKEWQANQGASYALMPKRLLLRLYGQYNGDIDIIGDYLQVSNESLTIRLDGLGLLNRERQITTYEVDKSYKLIDDSYMWNMG